MNITTDDIEQLAWQKMNGLIPCIVQDSASGRILMQGYMNAEAVASSLNTQKVTFYSRSKNRLWTKGETSGNYLHLHGLTADCDGDSLLATVTAQGPTCHKGTESCWAPARQPAISELSELQRTIQQRQLSADNESYTSQLLSRGVIKCAQKVGEEGVEVALAAVAEDDNALLNESADLLYHLMVTLTTRNLEIHDVCEVLRKRKK